MPWETGLFSHVAPFITKVKLVCSGVTVHRTQEKMTRPGWLIKYTFGTLWPKGLQKETLKSTEPFKGHSLSKI